MNMNLEDKINKILKKLVNIEGRLEKIDDKFNSIIARIDSLESKFEEKTNTIDNVLSDKADIQTTNKLMERIELLEKFKLNYENAIIIKESYDKRLNVLIHDIPADQGNVWEKCETTIKKFQDFL